MILCLLDALFRRAPEEGPLQGTESARCAAPDVRNVEQAQRCFRPFKDVFQNQTSIHVCMHVHLSMYMYMHVTFCVTLGHVARWFCTT